MVPSQGSTDVAGFPGESSTRRQAMCVDSLPVYARQLVAGGSAGAFAKTAVAPLKQIKMCFQFTSEVSHYHSFKKAWQHGGVSGFYRGNGASVLRIVPYAAFQFMTYEQYRSWMLDNFSALRTGHVVDLLAGSASGGTAVLCTYPLDLARASLSYPVVSSVAIGFTAFDMMKYWLNVPSLQSSARVSAA